MPYARLGDRAVLHVTGEAAEDFLQNLVTSDLDLLGEGEARPSALLTPQGKILFDFLVSRFPGGLRLDAAESVRGDLAKRLTLYRLRAKVGLEPLDEPVFAIWDERGAEGAVLDRRFPEGGVTRAYGVAPAGIAGTDKAAFDALRVRAGVAEGVSDFPASDLFPHDVLLDQNGGVSFKKGCYIGQEVVSRMQHRGTARRRIMLVASEGHLSPAAVISAGGKAIGTVLAAVPSREDGGRTDEGLGLVRIDRLAKALADGIPIEADGVPLTLSIPPWARYALPDLSSVTKDESP
ncbi:MAG: folate-binding protein YgfZ [Rhizobiaceae bacterium]|nr:folate-binding protein YgfZ [Rhizobiaceae bacterium]